MRLGGYGRFAAASVALGEVLILAACSGSGADPTPTPSVSSQSSAPTSPSTSVSPAPTPSPTVATTGPNVLPGEKPPELSALSARSSNSAAADEFARYWMRALDWAYATGDSQLAEAADADSCSDCSKFLRISIDDVSKKDLHYLGGRITVTSSQTQPNDRHFGAQDVVDVSIHQSALRIVDARGRRTNSAAAVTATYRVWVARVGQAWTVVDWKQAVQK